MTPSALEPLRCEGERIAVLEAHRDHRPPSLADLQSVREPIDPKLDRYRSVSG